MSQIKTFSMGLGLCFDFFFLSVLSIIEKVWEKGKNQILKNSVPKKEDFDAIVQLRRV